MQALGSPDDLRGPNSRTSVLLSMNEFPAEPTPASITCHWSPCLCPWFATPGTSELGPQEAKHMTSHINNSKAHNVLWKLPVACAIPTTTSPFAIERRQAHYACTAPCVQKRFSNLPLPHLRIRSWLSTSLLQKTRNTVETKRIEPSPDKAYASLDVMWHSPVHHIGLFPILLGEVCSHAAYTPYPPDILVSLYYCSPQCTPDVRSARRSEHLGDFQVAMCA
jgi:hypothetical protein